ncbi:MAG: sodium:solute symporter [Tannerella sp.]|jgi:Na+/proline symporter|nr:sodium:solute symporter [Tannerella sp.]
MNSYIILGVVFAYILLLFFISWLTGRNNSGNEAFFLGNRRSPWYIVAIGMVGSSVSGVSFVSVPGWVGTTDMTYMQIVIGFFVGYVIIAKVLLPLYYRLRLTSIYEYLESRLGLSSYKTGASFFILSKLLGSAAKLYIVIVILQNYVFSAWNIPFEVTVFICILVIWLYTFRSGMRTIVWTDTLQTVCLVAMLAIIIWNVKDAMHLNFKGMANTITESPHFRMFEFRDWSSRQHFVKQFLSGIFIPIVMTGLDQDMMQKNLTCHNLRDAQKNMYWYGFTFIPLNFMFLCLGVMLISFASGLNLSLPASGDDMLPMFCTSGLLGQSMLIFFTIGIIAAAFNSADSALTAITTSFCVDILGIKKEKIQKAEKTRFGVHILVSIVFAVIILLFRALNDRSIIDAIYTLVSYTYGPLLGLFAFGLFTKYMPENKYVPYICLAAPAICYGLDMYARQSLQYQFGYELLIINGLITFLGLWIFRNRKKMRIFAK